MFREPSAYPFTLEGGLDQNSSVLKIPPGKMISCDGLEIVANEPGYHRKAGYERCTNDTLPSDTDVIYLEIETITGTITAGDDFECGSVLIRPLESLAAPEDGDILPCATHSLSSISVSDTFTDGSNSFDVASIEIGRDHYTQAQLNTYKIAAIEDTRDNIPVVTGTGAIVGGFRLDGNNYVLRSSGTTAKLYLGGDYEWTEVAMPQVMYFEDGIIEPNVGDVITDGTAVATIASITRQEGSWNYEETDQSEGYFTLTGVTGTFTVGSVLTKSYTSVSDILNGNFTDTEGWTTGTGWAISGGSATKTAGVASNLEQEEVTEADKLYEAIYTISGYSAGTVTATAGGSGTGLARSSDGHYIDVVEESGGDGSFYFEADATFDGSIDNVSLTEVSNVVSNGTFTADASDWLLGGNSIWELGRVKADTLNYTAASQSVVTVPDQVYRIGFDSEDGTTTARIDIWDGTYLSRILNAPGYSTGSHYLTFRAVTASTLIQLSTTDQAGTCYFDNIVITDSANLLEDSSIYATQAWYSAGAEWTIGSGSAVCDGTQTTLSYLTQSSVQIEDDKTYLLRFTVSARTAGSITPMLASGEGSPRSTDGTFEEIITCDGASGVVGFKADADFDGTITGVYLYEVDANDVPVTELLTNGQYDGDRIWDSGTGWAIAAGVATKTAGTASDLEQAYSLASGSSVRVRYTVTRSAGSVTPKFGTDEGTARSADGTYSEIITTTTATTTFAFEADATFAGTVDVISVELADTFPAIYIGDFASDTIWAKGTGWAIAAGVATSDASQTDNSDLTQPFPLLADKSVSITFTVSGVTAGNVCPILGNNEGTDVSANGTYTQIIGTTTAVDTIGFRADVDFAGSIDDVTVTEAGYANVSATNYTYEIISGGRLETSKHNFTNVASNDSVFGVTGYTDAFEFDGTNFIPIFKPSATTYPKHVLIHQERLMLAFPAGEWVYSVSGQPRVFNTLLGAGTHSCGAEITGAKTVQGNTAVAFTEGSFWLLTGDGVYTDTTSTRNWSFFEYDENIGAEEYSIAGMGEYLFFNRGEIRSLKTTAAYGGFMTTPMGTEIKLFLSQHTGDVVDSLWVHDKGQYRIFFDDGKAAYITLSGGKYKGSTVVSFPDEPTVIWSDAEDGIQYAFFVADDGYLYRMDSGNTCDDGYVEGSFRLPFFNYGSARNTKQFLQMIVEFLAPTMIGDDTEFVYSVNFSHGSVDAPRPVSTTLDELPIAGGVYDSNLGYGNFSWSGPVTAEIVAYLEGYGANMSALISYKTKYDSSFSFLSVIVDYINMGMEQR